MKKLGNEVRAKAFTEIIIPTVGVFSVRNNLASVAFDHGLVQDSHAITNKHINAVQRKSEAKNFATVDNMDQFHLSKSGFDAADYEGRFMGMDEGAKQYLSSLQINPHDLQEGRQFRPMTATCDYDHLSTSDAFHRKSHLRGSSLNAGSRTNKTFRMTTKAGFFGSNN
jgi:hypothetical protein